MPDFKNSKRGYKQKGFTAFTKAIDPVKKPVGPVTPSTRAEYMNRQVFNLIQEQDRNKDGKDIVKSKEEQIKDLQNDINILRKRGNSGDNKRIKTLQTEIKRLQG
tara:strand:- start:12 stop:326 length:315 start_codon:yes stop_codon:yes gene_type:complete